MGRDELHVVMLPWCAFGHIIPFFQLSVSLAKAGVRVSFASTPRNIQRLPKIPPNLATLINFVELPMPRLEQLPEGAEATFDLPSMDMIQYLKLAYDLLHQPFRQYVSGHRPDWIIVDFAPHWAADVAQEFGVPLMMFSALTAAAWLFFGPPPEYLVADGQEITTPSPETWTSPPEWVDFPSTVAYRSFEVAVMHPAVYGDNASGISDGGRLFKVLRACRAVSVRSCYEAEGEYLNLYEKVIKRPVIPVGLLLPERTGEGRESNDKIFEWLDEQDPKSVVFVGFGSECKLTREQVFEIAHGLELSKLPFLWALRKPSWAADDLDALPPGFGRRTAGRGTVCIGWAPQLEILAHEAIGGSLFHSGWGSVIETLQFGHCLVVLPFIIDQGLNARLLVEKGLAVEVERSEEDGSFSGDGIAKSLRLAMVEEEGEGLRVRAREAAAVFGDNKLQQEHYFNGFVEYLKNEVAAVTGDDTMLKL